MNKGFWHDILYGGKTHYVSHKAITVAKNITQATDGVAVSKFPTIRRKGTTSPLSTHLLTRIVPQGRDVRTVALDKRAATKDATQAIDGEGAGKLPTIQRKNTPRPLRDTHILTSTANQGKGFWHDIMWWNTWNNIHKVSKRGATVTEYVTRTVTSFPTVTVRKTDTVYMTKIKTRTISVNGKAITTSDSKAVLESGGLMVPRPRYSGSVFAGAALAMVMVVYA